MPDSKQTIIELLARQQLPQSAIGYPVEFGRPITPNPDGSAQARTQNIRR